MISDICNPHSEDCPPEIKLLLLEDNPGDAVLVGELLSDWVETNRCAILHCFTLAEAITLLERNCFSLILVDLALPDSEGINTVLRIKAKTESPILILTGNNNEQLAIQALSAGAQDFLEKEHLDSRGLHRAILYAVERARSQALYKHLLTQYPDGIVVLDNRGEILFANPAAAQLWHIEREQLIGSIFEFPVAGNKRLEIQIANREIEMHVADGEWKGVTAWVVSLRDISEHKRLERHLSYLAHHDSLTGLANRELLNDRLSHCILALQRSDRKAAIFMLDLDRFKLVNDTLGHDAGDKLLVEVSKRLRGTVREADTVSRTGGDEFVIVAENIDNAGASHLARKILSQIAPPFIIDGRYFNVSCSIGIALYPRDGSTSEELFKHADAAMYSAKQAGRNYYRFHDETTHRNTIRRLELESDLESAIEQNQFQLYFQPQLDAKGVSGAEALLRWLHPQKGLLSPSEFIPLLEQSHLTPKVEMWVLLNACKQLQAWDTALQQPLGVSVNLSVLTLQLPHLARLIDDVLTRTHIKKNRLELEITESLLLKDVKQAERTLGALRELGVSVALDDFGTGYSSLGYLIQFHNITTLKLDHSVIRNLDKKHRNRAILSTVMDLGHTLNMKVVAEGVERRRQVALLQQMHCDIYQGFLFSPPIPAARWPEKFARWNQGALNWLPSA